jgi:outer membrane protein
MKIVKPIIYSLAICSILSTAPACKRVKNPNDSSTKTDSTAISTDTAAAIDTTTAAASTIDTSLQTTAATNSSTTAAVMPPIGAKYGYLNSLELLAMMPETRAADKKLAELQRSKEASFASLAQKYQQGMQDLQAKAQDMTRLDQETKMKELGDLEEKLQKMQMSSGDELAAEKEKLYAPILARADKYIKQIGKEQGYEYIFDAAALLYADTTKDILPLVKRKMGIK